MRWVSHKVYYCNVRTYVSFIPFLARLGLDLGQFEEGDRGGFIVEVEVQDSEENGIQFEIHAVRH